MLRKRSRPVTGTTATSKQPTPTPTPTPTLTPPSSSDHNGNTTPTVPPSTPPFFNSTNPNPFVMSPSSVLETKPALPTTTPLWLDTRRIFTNSLFTTQKKKITPFTNKQQPHPHPSWAQPRVGIALVDDDDDNNNTPRPNQEEPNQKSNLVLFGSNLRVQIPSSPPLTPPPRQPITTTTTTTTTHSSSPNSPVEFGIKTPRSNFVSLGRGEEDGSDKKTTPVVGGKVKGSISMEEMEQSEDYTCVISRGPVPKTTHIFDNCIVESCCGSSASPAMNGRGGAFGNCRRNKSSDLQLDPAAFGTRDFLSFCHHCKKRIGHGTDIFMYRGEKAFCSQECRGEGMLFDGVEF